MKRNTGLTFGAPLLVLILILLVAGCTQPSTAPMSTTTPVPTITHQVTTLATTTPATATTVQPDNQTLKAEMVGLAETLAGYIDRQNLSAALREGENSTALAAVLSQLRAFKANNTRITYDYVLEQKNGTVTLVITDEYGNPGAPQFMEAYIKPPEELKTPVTGPIGVGPYTDEWGTFVSGFAPVDLGTNTTVILVGVDSQV